LICKRSHPAFYLDWDKVGTRLYELYLQEIPFKIAPFSKLDVYPKSGLWDFSDCPKLVFDLQAVGACFLIGFGTRQPGCMSSIYKRSHSSTYKSSSFQKPKCSLWVFSDCPKLVFDLQAAVTCFLIRFGTRGPRCIKSINTISSKEL
jgi:hypothetical protein